MITLAYGSKSLQLAGPEFGDTLAENQSFKNNDLVSGVVVNNQAGRPRFQTIDYNVRGMTQTQLDELNEIISDARGHEVTLVAPLGETILAYLSNLDTEEITIRDRCAYDIRLQFLVKP